MVVCKRAQLIFQRLLLGYYPTLSSDSAGGDNWPILAFAKPVCHPLTAYPGSENATANAPAIPIHGLVPFSGVYRSWRNIAGSALFRLLPCQ